MINILLLLIQALWFALPAYTANAAPIITAKFLPNFLSAPVDFGGKMNGWRIFGSHKTFRGIVFAVIFALLTVYLQRFLHSFVNAIAIIDYSSPLLFGVLFGSGVAFGDLIKSFVKRLIRVKAGGRWFPWDNVDYIIGALVFVGFVFIPPVEIIIILLVISPIFSIFGNKISYWLGWKGVSW